MEIKIIKDHRIPPLLYKRSSYKQLFAVAMFGALGSLIFLVKFVCSGYYDSIEFTEHDFMGLGASLFLLAASFPSSLVLYVSSTLVELIESIVNDSQSEENS